MIDKGEIKAAAIKTCKGEWMCNGEYTESVTRFIDGIEWFKKNLWHSTQEEPEKDEILITKFLDEGINYEIDSASWVDNWKEHCRRNDIMAWCYVSDILS